MCLKAWMPACSLGVMHDERRPGRVCARRVACPKHVADNTGQCRTAHAHVCEWGVAGWCGVPVTNTQMHTHVHATVDAGMPFHCQSRTYTHACARAHTHTRMRTWRPHVLEPKPFQVHDGVMLPHRVAALVAAPDLFGRSLHACSHRGNPHPNQHPVKTTWLISQPTTRQPATLSAHNTGTSLVSPVSLASWAPDRGLGVGNKRKLARARRACRALRAHARRDRDVPGRTRSAGSCAGGGRPGVRRRACAVGRRRRRARRRRGAASSWTCRASTPGSAPSPVGRRRPCQGHRPRPRPRQEQHSTRQEQHT